MIPAEHKGRMQQAQHTSFFKQRGVNDKGFSHKKVCLLRTGIPSVYTGLGIRTQPQVLL